MGAFARTSKTCAAAALGLGLSLGLAVSADPSVAHASASQAVGSAIVITSSTEVAERTAFDIVGTAAPSSSVTILGLLDGLVTVDTDENGAFTYRSTDGLPAGVRRVQFADGSSSTEVEYRVRDSSGAVPVLAPLSVDEPEYVPGQKVTLTGTGTPGATVRAQFRTASVPTMEAEVAGDGRWTLSSPYAITGLEHEVRVRQHSDLGEEAPQTIRLRADASSFAPLTVDEPEYVPGQKVTLTGTGTPGATVRAQFRTASVPTMEAEVAGDGRWTLSSPYAITGLEHEVRVRQHSDLGEEAPQTIRLRADASSFAPLTVDEPEYVPGQKLRLSGTATPGGAVQLRVNSIALDTKVTAGADGKWSFESAHAVSGLSHEARVRQTAADGPYTVVELQARDENGEEPTFRALERTSAATYLPGGTTRLTGKSTSWSEIRVSLSNPGGKPLPGGSRQDFRVLAGADGTWSIDIPDHKLTKATVKQYSELGNDAIEFEFSKA
uniref:Bacterial Ig domain-containing protein n=1 Tax=Neobacillus citreus TaxID=2833578 RepID=A0A942Y9L9_9BACI